MSRQSRLKSFNENSYSCWTLKRRLDHYVNSESYVRNEFLQRTTPVWIDGWMDRCMDAIRKGQDTRNTRQTLIRSLSGLKTQSKNTWRNTSEFLAAKTLLLPLLRLRSFKIVVYFLLSGTDWLLLLFFKRTLNFPIEYTRLSPVPTTSIIIDLQTKITTKTKTRYMKIQGERSVRFEKKRENIGSYELGTK